MGKRGAPKHMKRIAVPKSVPIHDKKNREWMIKSSPGPHSGNYSIPLGVLIRDVLKLVRTSREVGRILSSRLVRVDGTVRVDEKFPVGLMDVVSFEKNETHYRIVLDKKGRLVPAEIKKGDISTKVVRIVKKHIQPKGKITLTSNDGRTIISDNHIMVGDSVVLSIPKVKIKTHLKRESGATCLIMDGKHAGFIVSLKEIIQRKGGQASEALVSQGDKEFITVAKYLFVINDEVYA